MPRRCREASATSLMCSGRLDEPVVRAVGVQVEPELRRDDDPVAHGRQGLADELLVDERAVDLGGVEEA